ncbi:hypothetical protein RJ55_00908 [Drechmeria coniospora]|nr:hypothetical protein RJ55_00908 [Drechmeria coniospora]
MKKLSTASVSLAVTPTVVTTLFSHYLHRKHFREQPTAHLSYDQGLHLIRSFLEFASHHTVEELQAFTSQSVPCPQWVKADEAVVSDEQLTRSADLLQAHLGPDGIRQVGGKGWWQWRKPKSSLQAEWIEMRSDANERKKTGDAGKRVMMYIHGGAYFFGSVDEHRYQMQRHARKLKARVFAPKYRLAPQFPFPCGLQDCLAAYLHLLQTQHPSTIVLAGDSAGGGMVVSLLCVLRDQGVPLPAGAILISPWVDLTHSFPSLSADAPLDYIPQSGFHHKPSRAWPPLDDAAIAQLREEAAKRKLGVDAKKPAGADTVEKRQLPSIATSEKTVEVKGDNGEMKSDTEGQLSIMMDGELVTIKDQIHMYTTNALLTHPLVSPVMQPTLGGLPPVLVMVGGGEILRDEQIFLAHKFANPAKYAPSADIMTDRGRELLQKYCPTDVQLQVWDGLCHVAPTLSFTRPAKYMFRSVSQFGAWAFARAQKTGIEIMDDDAISVISTESDTDISAAKQGKQKSSVPAQVGKAGDPLPPFRKHMIRQRVTRHGMTLPLAPESDLPGCCMESASVCVIKEEPVKKWMAMKRQWDDKYSSATAKVHRKIVKDLTIGLRELYPDEHPPPTALAGRVRIESELAVGKNKRSLGLAFWSLLGSKHDEATVEREKQAGREPDVLAVTGDEGQGARPFADIEAQKPALASADAESQNHSECRTVIEEQPTDGDVDETPIAALLAERRAREDSGVGLGPNYVPKTGVAGKRPILDGIALPFSLKKDAETASMLTLNSAVSPGPNSPPMTPLGPQFHVTGPLKAEAAVKTEQEQREKPAVLPEVPTIVAPDSVTERDDESRSNTGPTHPAASWEASGTASWWPFAP